MCLISPECGQASRAIYRAARGLSSCDRLDTRSLSAGGLDAHPDRVIDATDPVHKKRVGWLAYVSATLRVMRVRKTLSMTMSLDGARARRVRCHTTTVIVPSRVAEAGI